MKRATIHQLCFDEVTFYYEKDKEIFQNFSFNFLRPYPVILQGPVGVGKSTLLKLLLGFFHISQGHYVINNQNATKLNFRAFDEFRLNMGYSSDVAGLISNRTLFENFSLPLSYHGLFKTQEQTKHIKDLFEQFEISDYMHLRPALAPAGVRKIANLIKSLILDPEILVLNSPTSGLTHHQVDLFLNLIRSYHANKNLKQIIAVSDDSHFISSIGGEIFEVTKSKLDPINKSLESRAA